MQQNQYQQQGFTLVEIAIVLLIVTMLLGYTVALFPKQQELKQYREAEREMDEIIASIIGFAQVNGRLPCPAIPNTAGIEDGGGNIDCNNFGGFVPVNTLGFSGRLNADSLLMDPWGNPYRYYVSDSDADNGGVDDSDFVINREMREIGIVDIVDIHNADLSSDDRIDLDGPYLICDGAGTTTDDLCTGAALVFGRPDDALGTPYAYAGAPFVLLSQGKNWNEGDIAGDELENRGANETDDFDDIVKWVSPNILFSKMIEADQLP